MTTSISSFFLVERIQALFGLGLVCLSVHGIGKAFLHFKQIDFFCLSALFTVHLSQPFIVIGNTIVEIVISAL